MKMPKNPTECKYCKINPNNPYYECHKNKKCNCTLRFIGLQTYCDKLIGENK